MKLKNREKILFTLACIAAAILLFDRLHYSPQNRKIYLFKEEIKAADTKLKEFTLLSQGVEATEAEINRLEKELKGLNERILKGEEFRTFLRHLARESDPLQMKIISLTPQEEKISPPEEKKGTPSLQYKKVIVKMVFHSTYAKLGAYLRGVEELPFLIHIDSLQVERNEEIQPFLKVTMGLNMFITSL
jgi:hypothetical protein